MTKDEVKKRIKETTPADKLFLLACDWEAVSSLAVVMERNGFTTEQCHTLSPLLMAASRFAAELPQR